MSFSPDIDTKGYTWANIFANDDYSNVNPPIPGYFNVTGHNGFTSALRDAGEVASDVVWTSTPLMFPTMEAFPHWMLEYYSVPPHKYYRVWYCAILNRAPEVTAESSNFFNWNKGFGFGIQGDVFTYTQGLPGESDTYTGTVDMSEVITRNDRLENRYFQVDHNCEDAKEYMQSSLLSTPHMAFRFSVSMYAAYGVYESDGSADMQQVLYASSVRCFNAEENIIKASADSGGWVKPLGAVTTAAETFDRYPYMSKPQPTSDGYTGDLRLFTINTIYHSYDSRYGYVREDLKKRFKIRSDVIATRDEYVDNRINYYAAVLGSTFKIPKDHRTRVQPSPTLNRETYSAITGDSYDSATPSSIPTVMTSTSDGGGSY